MNTPSRTKPKPAYFLSLEVENVRCFGKPQTLDLSDGNAKPRQWNVILGNNGVGKTTLLRSLVAVSSLEETSKLYNSKPWNVEPGNNYSQLVYEELVSTWDPRRNNKAGLTKLTVSFSSGSAIKEMTDRVTNHRIYFWFEKTQGYTLETKIAYGGLICYAYGAGRKMGSTQLSKREKTSNYETLFNDNAVLLNPEEWLLNAEFSSLKGDSKSKKYLEAVQHTLLAILPEVEGFRSESEGVFDKRILFKTPFGEVPFTELSLGYQTMTAWLVDFTVRLFERYPDSPNPLAQPAILLIDEIDLHLHPKWQRQLTGFLTKTFPNTQFIVTAHSPLIVQEAADANVFVLKREGDEVIIEKDPVNVHNWRIDQILTSDLFGLEGARSRETEQTLDRRRELLRKDKLTAKEKAELKRLEEGMGEIPVAETPEAIRAMDIIQKAAKRIKP
ncbi:MAG: AAA family ATPase [Cytophagales bacterium]|nr:AAA family ATPase [Cytophagales bacterium]